MIILEANKLAAKHKLCRVTDSVRRDTKSNCVVVTETVYTLSKSGEADRKESYYHYKSMVDTESMDGLIQECKARSTYYFLGLEIPEQVVAKVIEDKVVVSAGADVKLEVEKPVEVEKPKKVVKKKAASKKKAVKKAAKKVEPVVEEVVEDEFIKVNEHLEVFSKSNKGHFKLLVPFLVKSLGKDWKSDNGKRTRVRAMILHLDENRVLVDDNLESVAAKFLLENK